ncbi:hypothetical protein M404DRAFT_19880 [Pisolithus tinctorius Marx 270]|uniref:Uncharacterized protein n=1 Tax=Pisolithus tinctorius Marx 270 TaxID=870435 RepID=A0A0C3PSF0_PISTI|nr:hypothetical protein M404DRAFT_19880 [Pisolithus tinctorius Marx 270]
MFLRFSALFRHVPALLRPPPTCSRAPPTLPTHLHTSPRLVTWAVGLAALHSR